MSNCPNCGAALSAPDHKGTLRCSYCGSLIEVGAIEWCPNKNISEHELLLEKLKGLKVPAMEPVYIDFHLDNEQLNKYLCDYSHAADALRYMIGGIDES